MSDPVKRISKFGPKPMGLGSHRFFVQLFAEDEAKVLKHVEEGRGESAAAIVRDCVHRDLKGVK